MLKKISLCLLLAAAASSCSHAPASNSSPTSPAPQQATCYQPNAEPFASPLPDGMNVEEGRPKGIFGALDKDDIRGVIKGKLDEVRHCYEVALAGQPRLFGRVTIQFVIAGGGSVSASRLVSSTLGSAQTETCIAEHMCGWHFPATIGGGPVVVTYPFNFIP